MKVQHQEFITINLMNLEHHNEVSEDQDEQIEGILKYLTRVS